MKLKLLQIEKYSNKYSHYSEFCRDAILEKIQREFSDQFYNEQIEFHKEQIQEYEKKKKINQDNNKKFQGLMDHWFQVFKNKWQTLEDIHIKDRINRLILPELQKYNFINYSENNILKIFKHKLNESKSDTIKKESESNSKTTEIKSDIIPSDKQEIKNIFDYLAPNYQKNMFNKSDKQRYSFIEKSVMPNLKNFGFKGTVEEVDDVLLNWPEQGGDG